MPNITVEQFNQRGAGKLPGHLGIVVTLATPQRMEAELPVQQHLLAPNGYLHAGSLVTLADVLQPALRQGYAVAGLVALGWEDMRAFIWEGWLTVILSL